MQKKQSLIIKQEAFMTLYEDAVKRKKIEACGLLLGTRDDQNGWCATQTHPLTNTYASPTYFEFDPEELMMAELTVAKEIIGVYHSHPTGYDRASTTDQDNMKRVNIEQEIPWVWLIICGPFDECIGTLSQEKIERKLQAYHHYEEYGLRNIPLSIAG